MNEPTFQLPLSDAQRLQRNLRTLKSDLDTGPQSYRTHECMKLLVDVLLDVLPQEFSAIRPASHSAGGNGKLELAAPVPPPAPAPAIIPLENGTVSVAGSPSAEEAMALLTRAMPNAGAEITPPTGMGGKPATAAPTP